MTRDTALATNERPELLLFCGVLGVVGHVAPLVAIVWATLVAKHDFIADTISDLARGPHHAIMDTGFYCNAAGALALAIAAAHLHLGRVWWSVGLFCLAGLGLVITMLGLWDELHSATEAQRQGLSVHSRLTFLLAPLYLVGPLAMRRGARRAHGALPGLFLASAVIWAIFATAFKLGPDSIDGMLEKVAILGTMLWTVPLSLLFLKHGRDCLD